MQDNFRSRRTNTVRWRSIMRQGALVFHPGLQHSHQLAWALHEIGLLQFFFSGIPVLGPGERPPSWWPSRIQARLKQTEIPLAIKQSRMHGYIAAKLVSAGVPESRREEIQHRYFHAYDEWASKQVLRIRPQLVVAFENSALKTFMAAKSIGAKCILDLPSIERSAAKQILAIPQTDFRTEIDRRKDGEVAAADLLLTCSRLAADTYVRSGVHPERIRSVLLGGAAGRSAPLKNRVQGQGVRFVFAGAFSFRKSADLLIEVFGRLHRQGINASLDIVGPTPEARYSRAARAIPTVRVHGSVSQARLLEIVSSSDCLLLPSRFDSFGMVVAEALGCGTPVIVSSATGARELVEQHPLCGWIVHPELESIYGCVAERIENPKSLAIASAAALRVAKSFSWAEYRRSVGGLIADWCNQRR